jgi:hypothetical protein
MMHGHLLADFLVVLCALLLLDSIADLKHKKSLLRTNIFKGQSYVRE